MQALSSQDVAGVLATFNGALSQSLDVRKPAEEVLAALEERTGFCSCLLEIIATGDNDHSARWLAATQLKNCMGRHWRSRPGQGGISPEEKTHLRSKLSALIPQDDNQIAVQVALIYAKVARNDYPREWPSLFHDLLANLDTSGQSSVSSTLTVRRVYLILHHIIKELSSKRLFADQKSFSEISNLLFEHIWSRWCADSQALLAGVPAGLETPQQPGQPQPLLVTFERWMLLLKIMRRLIMFGHVSDAKSLQPVQAVSVCTPVMAQVLQQLLALRPRPHEAAPQPQQPSRRQLLSMLDRGILKLLKTHSQILDTHPWSFHASGALLTLLALTCDAAMAPPPSAGGAGGSTPSTSATTSPAERQLIASMSFVKAVLDCDAYKGKTSGGRQADPSNEQDAPVAALAAQAQASLAGFWGRERLTGLCTSLTEHLMLTQRDLEEWSVCPEGFFHACDDSAWAERSNLCAETLMLTLLTQHKVLLCPVVVHLLTAVSAECPTGATVGTMPGPRVCGLPAALLRKEAVYHAVSAAAYELHDYIDWGQWLRSSLLPELSDATPVMRPLRRRVAALVGDWVARVENVDRPALYRALVGCMSEADACLQLTAVSTLRSLVDDWNFSDEQFAEWVGPTMQLLVHMLKAADELDSQTASFNLMNLVIERMGDHIRPFVTPILQLMPQLWADAEGAPLVRIQVLLAMCRLVHTLGPESPACYALVLPPTSTSIDVSNPESLSLMEDGLALLLILLRNAPDAERGAPLLSLAPLLASAMAASTEHIRFGVAVLTSMVLLGGAPFMQAHGASVASVFTAFFGNVNERGMLLLFPAMELVLGAVPSVAPSVLQPALTRLLGLLMAGRESEVVTSNAMTVFARLLLISPAAFTQLLSDAAASGVSPPGAPPGAAASPEALLSALLDAWTDGFDSLASTRARKLCAVAMCRLLALPSPALLDALEPLLVCITGVWSELEGGADDGAAPSYGLEYSWSVGDDGGLEVVVVAASDEAEGECMRRRALSESDPVGHTAVSAALREGLSAAQAAHGQALHTRLAAMDGSIAAQVQAATSAPPPKVPTM
ncbi:hypothetical protein FOA52_001739 [Chlamydomonas sp. UWO 241]|nr:hypothetical protein FOA52_001739 [Chlamydomonas sp. UWO 241]